MNQTSMMTAAAATLACTAGAVLAAPRVTLFEEFTATWCGYCPYMADAFLDLHEANPDSSIGIMIHISDDYTTAWGNSRSNFYGVGGIPHGVFDGVTEVIGGSPGMNLTGYFNSANSQSTDVTVSLNGGGSGTTYDLDLEVGVEAGGTGKTMRIHLLQCYNQTNWPESNEQQFNTVRQAMASQDVYIGAGQTHTINHTFNLSGESASNTNEVVFVAWAQSTANGDPAPIHNAAKHGYGEAPPANVTVGAGGDYASIQDALDAVGSGSTITVMPGTYDGGLDFNGRSVTLQSTDGAEATIIDAMGQSAGLDMTQNESPTIRGFTISNGASSVGAGARITGGSPSISECIFSDNTSSSNYVIFSVGTPMIADTHFCGNSHNTIGGTWTDGGGNSFEDDCPGGEPCPGDANGDGTVNVNDILEIISGYGTEYDVNDILEALGNFGANC